MRTPAVQGVGIVFSIDPAVLRDLLLATRLRRYCFMCDLM
jgi:hypothetical protein